MDRGWCDEEGRRRERRQRSRRRGKGEGEGEEEEGRGGGERNWRRRRDLENGEHWMPAGLRGWHVKAPRWVPWP